MILDNPILAQQVTELSKGNVGDRIDVTYPPANLLERLFPRPGIVLERKPDSVVVYDGPPSPLFGRFTHRPVAEVFIGQNETKYYDNPPRGLGRIGDPDVRTEYRANPKGRSGGII